MRRVTTVLMTGCFLFSFSAGCDSTPEFRESRAQRLMGMAAEESEKVANGRLRLKHELNIANMQIDNDYYADGRETLRRAMATLKQMGDDLDSHTRLAGWVSVSELSRRTEDDTVAMLACDQAVKLLRSLKPIQQRCNYVRGVAAEIRQVRGKPAAAALLREAAPWIKTMTETNQRRQACKAIASDLFLYNDYDGGKMILRLEDDADWRVTTLTQLANRAISQKAFGKNLNYYRNFSPSFVK
ncbi:MAG: hypothetical protein K8S55_14400 [Phycisphaerae bacterium]|nr:hypothetical protein [Phycisphaerae bacterium]